MLSEWATHVVAASGAVPVGDAPPLTSPDALEVEIEIDEHGHFSLGGWAVQAGQMALVGVTFRARRGGPVAVGDIRIVAEGLVNIAGGGPTVLGDAGFAPDGEGFTLIVAASAPGAFAATGRYELAAA